MRSFGSLDELRAAAGTELGVSGWHTVTQERVALFAAATDDHQWIHVDPDRAAAGPYGATVAHGFLTLALTPMLVHQVYEVAGVRASINYGCNRVRFPAPLRSGAAVRARVRLESVDNAGGGVQLVTRVDVEVEGLDRPCCVADLVTRLMFD